MLHLLILVSIPLTCAQVPLYLRTPALATPLLAPVPIAQLQCAQQCMPSCLPSCLIAKSPAYQTYQPLETVPTVPTAPLVQMAPSVVMPSAAFYQPYGYYPVVPTCAEACMPTCAPTCVATPSSPSPQRDDLPTPPPETEPTVAPEETTTTTVAPTDVVPCKCLLKITITQGNKTISKCGPNSCACPKNYNPCGSNCCRV